MDVDRLGVFRAVAREGGFSRAARRLHRTQPAVSHSIRVLEDELAERLFVRAGRRIELTPAGELFLEHVEQAFEALEQGRRRLDALRDLEAGTLTIGTSDTTACYLLPPVLEAFRARHPGVELRLSNRPSPVTLDQVLAREVDLGLVTLPVRKPGVATTVLAGREDVAIFAPKHPLAARKRIRLDDLMRHPLLLLDRGSESRTFIEARMAACTARTGEHANVAMELASVEVIKRLVALDFGVSVVPAIAVRAEVAAGELAAHRLFRRSEQRALGAVWRERPGPSRAALAFLEIARSLLGEADGPERGRDGAQRVKKSRHRR